MSKKIDVELNSNTKRLTFSVAYVTLFLAITGNPFWIFRPHDELSRSELRLDYFIHGFFSCLFLVACVVALIVRWIANTEKM